MTIDCRAMWHQNLLLSTTKITLHCPASKIHQLKVDLKVVHALSMIRTTPISNPITKTVLPWFNTNEHPQRLSQSRADGTLATVQTLKMAIEWPSTILFMMVIRDKVITKISQLNTIRKPLMLATRASLPLTFEGICSQGQTQILVCKMLKNAVCATGMAPKVPWSTTGKSCITKTHDQGLQPRRSSTSHHKHSLFRWIFLAWRRVNKVIQRNRWFQWVQRTTTAVWRRCREGLIKPVPIFRRMSIGNTPAPSHPQL